MDVTEGGKIKKHHKSEFIFSEVVSKFQELSYFDQHLVTSQCGQTVIEMVQNFTNCSTSIHLPVPDHVSFLFDLAGQALNIQALLDWCIALLRELPLVEQQLIERGSVLTREYTTTLALCIVGVLKKYHGVILSESDVRVVWDSLVDPHLTAFSINDQFVQGLHQVYISGVLGGEKERSQSGQTGGHHHHHA